MVGAAAASFCPLSAVVVLVVSGWPSFLLVASQPSFFQAKNGAEIPRRKKRRKGNLGWGQDGPSWVKLRRMWIGDSLFGPRQFPTTFLFHASFCP